MIQRQLKKHGATADVGAALARHLVQSTLTPSALATPTARRLLGDCLRLCGAPAAISSQASVEELQQAAQQVSVGAGDHPPFSLQA